MWTDARYYIQAEKEIYAGWEMKKMERGQQDLQANIKEIFNKDSRVGIDMNLVSNEYFESLDKFLVEFNIIHDDKNIIDQIWDSKPQYSVKKVIIHDIKFAG